ncbi:MAG: response regulator [Myxococcales bacterium]|nr:response regulator [Myxococcales bacterium]MDD9971088.1 response regulator [Myxococcales bacterium]
MTTILTIDDARAVRMLVRKALKEMPFDIEEAEDGEKGLEKVGECTPDLILLDVTMPVMDGPAMLEKLRAQGDQTPVILLTAESGSAIIGPMLQRGGVCDYVIKPFKPEQLRAKVIEALQSQGAVPDLSAPAKPAPDRKKGNFQPAGKTFVDVLVVDDMENVAKKFKGMLPDHLSFNSCIDRQSSLSMCRDRVYRTIVIDTEIPDVDSVELYRDLRILQPTAAFVALVLRTTDKPESFVEEKGFDSFLVKPFNAAQIAEFLGAYFESLDVLQIDENVMKPAPFAGPAEGQEAFFKRLGQAAHDALDDAAAACYEDVIMDLDEIPASQKLQKMLVKLAERSEEVGLTLRVVANDEVDKLLKQLVETANIAVFPTLGEAQAAAK